MIVQVVIAGFNLPSDYQEDPEAILRRARANLTPPRKNLELRERSSSRQESQSKVTDEPSCSNDQSTSTSTKTLCEYSMPTLAHIPVLPSTSNVDFELKPHLIRMAQAIAFNGKPSEDANAHLRNFLEICSTISVQGVSQDAIRLRLFPFSLVEKAKQWFLFNSGHLLTWVRCADQFLNKFCPISRTILVRSKISNFGQGDEETITEAWERLQEYVEYCPHHGMQDWYLIQSFYNGLQQESRQHIDAAAGGAYLSLTVEKATKLIETMVANQGWTEKRARGMSEIKQADSVTLQTLVKLLEQRINEKRDRAAKEYYAKQRAASSSEGQAEIKKEDAKSLLNNGGYGEPPIPMIQQWNNKGMPQTSVFNSPIGKLVSNQGRINDSINNKLIEHDKMLEGIYAKLKDFSEAFKEQINFNKRLEQKVDNIKSQIKYYEEVKAVTTRGGKSTRDPPHPNLVPSSNTAAKKNIVNVEEDEEEETPAEPSSKVRTAPHEFYDTHVLPFPDRNRNPTEDDQFKKFVEVIQKLYIHVPFIDAMQVPTYAKYLRDMLNKKKPIPSRDVVKLTEDCSAVILNQLPEKKKDPGNPTIACSIGEQHFEHALCDLGASVSVMPKVIYDKLNHHTLSPTSMCLQLADQSLRYPAGIAENIPVKIRNLFVPVDFVVLDINPDHRTPLILGRPFLSTAKATIDVGAGEIQLHISGKEEKFQFTPRPEKHPSSRFVGADIPPQPP